MTEEISAEATAGIRARGLVKRYGALTALAGVDLTVPPGTVLGLLGLRGVHPARERAVPGFHEPLGGRR